ncbi:MAG TPA: FAD-dependent oxidoreductase [Drouetiella sp.]
MFDLENELNTKSVAVIGAGLSGLVCAHLLEVAGVNVTVFDKGRFPGGRLASRNRDQHCFDYGAQYFTARSANFNNFLNSSTISEAVAKWTGRFGKVVGGTITEDSDVEERFVGLPRMRSIADALAATLDCKLSHRVSELSKTDSGKWRVKGELHHSASKEQFFIGDFDLLVLSMPPAQAQQLHKFSGLSGVVISPCFALLLSFDERIKFNWDGVKIDDEVVSWIARDSSKPGRPDGERWVVHASPHWSERNYHLKDSEIEKHMFEKFASLTGINLPSVCFSKLHKWKFARTVTPLGEECIYDPSTSIVYCGDWCIGARMEGAYLSGSAAAKKVMLELKL